MSQGWIKLHRVILENPIVCKDSDYFSIWCYLLLNATHKEQNKIFKGKKIILKKGQLITGRKVIGKQFNITESKVQRVLKKLEIEQQIEQQTSNANRLISIVNWENYQSVEQQSEQPVNNQRTTSEQPVNTNKNDKNEKNEKNDKKREVKTPVEFETISKEYRLVNGEYNGVFTEETSVNSEETSVIANIPTEESTQKKVKKNKEEESKTDIDIFFETVWKERLNKRC
jgi:hypothetical protein